jgi:hypothetical protein
MHNLAQKSLLNSTAGGVKGLILAGFFLERFCWFFMGFLGEIGVSTWCFDGECVVVCVAKVVRRMSFFGL